MEEANQSRCPAEPSEDELRAMIDERERLQAAGMSRLKRIATWILCGIFAFLAIGFFATGMYQDIAYAMSEEEPQPAVGPASTRAAARESDEVMLKRAAGIPVEEKKSGKIIDEEDIRFTMELMQFMQGPSNGGKQPAAKPKPAEGK